MTLPPPRRAELPTPPAALVGRRAAAVASGLARHLPAGVVRRDRVAVARGLRRMFNELGGTFIKFGQLIASAPSLFGEDVAGEFRGCLDAGPPVPFALVRSTVEAELGAPIGELFAEFEREPMAAASIAVVHRATLGDGRTVAVKVLRPRIERVIAGDLAVMRPLFDFVGRQVALGVAGALPGLVDGMQEQVAEELDLRNELDALAWFGSVTSGMGFGRLRVPAPVQHLSSRRVLTMEYLPGVPIDRAEPGEDMRQGVSEMVLAWFATALVHGVFHGDVHAGNLLRLDDGSLAILDWGIVGRFDPDTHRFFRRMVEAVLGDEAAWPEIARHVSAIYGPGIQEVLGIEDDQMVRFVRMQMEPMLTRPFGEVDLRMLFAGGDLPGPDRSRRATLAAWRTARRLQRQIAADGIRGTTFDRSSFLLGKQMIYLDRYGKRFMPDLPIIWDPEVFRRLLAPDGEEAVTGATAEAALQP